MNIEVTQSDLSCIETEILALTLFADFKIEESIISSFDEASEGAITELLESGDFRGRKGETYILRSRGQISAKRIFLVGLGEKGKFSLEVVREASAIACRSSARFGELACWIGEAASDGEWKIEQVTQAWIEGAILADYTPNAYKTDEFENYHLNTLKLVINEWQIEKVKRGIMFGQYIGGGVNVAREISDAPPASMTPQKLLEKTKNIAAQTGLRLKTLSMQEIEQARMGGLLAVARGSSEPPVFLILEHTASTGSNRPIVLIGKGITFDSGGLNLKNSEKMKNMKYDKAGAAAVIGIMKIVTQLNLPLHVVALIPAAENLPSGCAFKPGDVIHMANGKTVEITSTDAEGRLILADALSYAQRYNPEAVIDLATLTGACVIALGKVASCLFSNSSKLLYHLKEAGNITGERVWPFPLYPEYCEQVKGHVADLRNSAGREGGACTAASFLKEFTNYEWAHVDITGVAWDDETKAYNPKKGATGAGVRLITQFLKDKCGM